MDVLIGCPVVDRAWIIASWVDHIADSAERAGITPRLVLLGDPTDPTLDVARCRAQHHQLALLELHETGQRWAELQSVDERRRRRRPWNPGRYAQITAARNQLLDEVRLQGPDVFMSIDSDILLAPETITNLLESLADYDAVAGLTFLSPGRSVHNINAGQTIHWRTFDKRPYRPGHVYRVDIVMALVAMNRHAYHVDYENHANAGEDIGWSRNARIAGLACAMDARVPNKHVMDRTCPDEVDPRCGW